MVIGSESAVCKKSAVLFGWRVINERRLGYLADRNQEVRGIGQTFRLHMGCVGYDLEESWVVPN